MGVRSWSIIFCNVAGSLTLPSKIRLRREKPLPSSTSAKVTSGQSLRFSLEWPKAA
jgi:hypothetical protein